MNKYDLPLATLDHNALVGYFRTEDGASNRSPKDEADARALRMLFALQRAGIIRLLVPMSEMLENRRVGDELDIAAYSARLVALGFDPQDVFTGPRTIAFTTPDDPSAMTFGAHLEIWLNEKIHAIYFEGKVEPGARNVNFRWLDFRKAECERLGITGEDRAALLALDFLWMNRGWQPAPHRAELDGVTPEKRAELEAHLATMRRIWNNRKCDALNLVNHVSHVQQTTVPQHAVFVTSDRNFTKPDKLAKLKVLGFPGYILQPDEAVAYYLKLTGVTLDDVGAVVQDIAVGSAML